MNLAGASRRAAALQARTSARRFTISSHPTPDCRGDAANRCRSSGSSDLANAIPWRMMPRLVLPVLFVACANLFPPTEAPQHTPGAAAAGMERPAADRCRVAPGVLDDAAPSSRPLRRLGDCAPRSMRELARTRSSQHGRWSELGYFDGPAWSGGHGLLRSPVRHTRRVRGSVSAGPIHGRIVHRRDGVLPRRETARWPTLTPAPRHGSSAESFA